MEVKTEHCNSGLVPDSILHQGWLPECRNFMQLDIYLTSNVKITSF